MTRAQARVMRAGRHLPSVRTRPMSSALAAVAPSGTLRCGVVVAPAASAFFAIEQDGVPRGVTVDLFAALGQALNAPVELVLFPNSGELTEATATGEIDVAFMPQDAERAKKVDFGPPYILIESTFLVPAGSRLTHLRMPISPARAPWRSPAPHRPQRAALPHQQHGGRRAQRRRHGAHGARGEPTCSRCRGTRLRHCCRICQAPPCFGHFRRSGSPSRCRRAAGGVAGRFGLRRAAKQGGLVARRSIGRLPTAPSRAAIGVSRVKSGFSGGAAIHHNGGSSRGFHLSI